MSLDGLRAWIGEVERRLRTRTRVFLVLVAIAVGGAAVGIYLAIDAQDSSVSKAEVENVRTELETRIGESSGATDLTELESELETLRAEVAELRSDNGPGEGDKGTGGNGGQDAQEPPAAGKGSPTK